ncbi:MAG TPA: DUF998 domain-containing protein [Thermoplasmata archaeon]|nr:DUF998 domain-containing protein [Thermoplasmata archaeon]
MTSLGPLVPRSARWAGPLLIFGSLQFVVAMIVTQLRYPGYSDISNYVSDLGSSSSPFAFLFNDSIRILGVLGVLAALLIRPAFAPRTSNRIGIAALVVASVGAFLVGSYPEGSPQLNGSIHSVVSLVTFLGSGVALLTLGPGMMRDTRWDGFRGYTFFSGVITIVALVLFVAIANPPLIGPGGAERIIIAPILLWAVVVGSHLLTLRAYAPAAVASSS